eukprot:jgi/Galph1/2760/GphlegSOOS_G1386.1
MVRFGILSTATIANRIADAIELAGHEVYAIASRDESRARKWAANRQVVQCYGSYDQLLADENVEAVYIPLPSSLADQWALRAAELGKHILVEKPFSSSENLRQIISRCKRYRVAFLDGTQFVHGPRIKEMQRMVEHGEIGKLRKVNAAFTAWIVDPSNIRYDSALEPAGCIGDVGWYVVRFILSFVGYGRKVLSVYARGTETERGAIEDCVGVIEFEGEINSHFDCGFTSGYRQWGECLGTLGILTVERFQGAPVPQIKMEDPNLKFRYRRVGEEKDGHIQRIEGDTIDLMAPDVGKLQSVLLIETFVSLMTSDKEHEKWMDEALRTQSLVDAIYQSAKTKQTVYFD